MAHHRRHFTPQNAILVAVGDFDPRRLVSQVKKCFGQWAPHARPLPPPARSRWPAPHVRRIRHAGEQVHIMLGHLGIARNHPDYDALAVLDYIFGSGPGFCDRLGRIVRDELGLAYSISGGMTDSADVVSGAIPGLRRHHARGSRSSGRRHHRPDPGDAQRGHSRTDEVDSARRYLAGAWAFEFQTVEQRADRLLELERWGLDLDEPGAGPNGSPRSRLARSASAARRHLSPMRSAASSSARPPPPWPATAHASNRVGRLDPAAPCESLRLGSRFRQSLPPRPTRIPIPQLDSRAGSSRMNAPVVPAEKGTGSGCGKGDLVLLSGIPTSF